MTQAKVSIVVPAHNAADRIAATVGGILPPARVFLEDFEVILVNNSSTDSTGTIMDCFAARDLRISVIHCPQQIKIGFALKTALDVAKFEAITLIPGDRSFQNESIARMFKAATAADMVITYRNNRATPSFPLRFLLNLMFRFCLADYQSIIIWPAKELRTILVKADCHADQIFMLISLLKLGLTYVQVPVSLTADAGASSSSMKFSEYIDLAKTVAFLRLSLHAAGAPIGGGPQFWQKLATKIRALRK